MLNSSKIFVVIGLAAGLLSGCQYEQLNRSETMSFSTGNAMAHNSALQIIDPWPRSAGNNHLRVPATKYGADTSEKGSAPPKLSATSGPQQ